MNYWNYRILKKKNPFSTESYFEVCEVHYDVNNTPRSWTDNHQSLSQEDLDDLKMAYTEIKKAFDKPILEVVNNELIEIQ